MAQQWVPVVFQLLRRAGVVFVFSDAEAAELHDCGVKGVWDVQARVARKADGGKVGLYEAWSGVIGAPMGVVALHKNEDTTIHWTTYVDESG